MNQSQQNFNQSYNNLQQAANMNYANMQQNVNQAYNGYQQNIAQNAQSMQQNANQAYNSYQQNIAQNAQAMQQNVLAKVSPQAIADAVKMQKARAKALKNNFALANSEPENITVC